MGEMTGIKLWYKRNPLQKKTPFLLYQKIDQLVPTVKIIQIAILKSLYSN